ncbi:MAG: sugar nucleotide-binding protein [bacterium]|nr:sugar nucleotide-binding protein [bacterium]
MSQSNTESVLVSGGSGFIGTYLCKSLIHNSFNVYCGYLNHKPDITGAIPVKLDVTSLKDIEEKLSSIKIDQIIHLAYSKGPSMEDVIVKGTKNISQYARKINAGILFLSTDLVFSGEKGSYSESDEPKPVITYGKFKLTAENEIKVNNGYIVRTSLVYDSKELSTMKEFAVLSLIRKEVTPLFIDEFRSPIDVEELARGITEIILNKPKQKLWHLAGPERISRFEFGKLLAQKFNLDQNLIKPLSILELKEKRPQDTSLDCQLFFRQFFRTDSPKHCLKKK